MTYLELFGVFFEILLSQNFFIFARGVPIRVALVLGGLLQHQLLHHSDLLLKLALLLGHEVFDLIQNFFIAL